jgi:hypothetical protein
MSLRWCAAWRATSRGDPRVCGPWSPTRDRHARIAGGPRRGGRQPLPLPSTAWRRAAPAGDPVGAGRVPGVLRQGLGPGATRRRHRQDQRPVLRREALETAPPIDGAIEGVQRLDELAQVVFLTSRHERFLADHRRVARSPRVAAAPVHIRQEQGGAWRCGLGVRESGSTTPPTTSPPTRMPGITPIRYVPPLQRRQRRGCRRRTGRTSSHWPRRPSAFGRRRSVRG